MSSACKKILWVSSDILHPLNKGGRLRTFGILQSLNKRHEIVYVGLNQDSTEQDIKLANEYCSRMVVQEIPDTHFSASKKFLQLLESLFKQLPYSVYRLRSSPLLETVIAELNSNTYDLLICDFVHSGINIPDQLSIPMVLFQHNAEAHLWQRRADSETKFGYKSLYQLQARLMRSFEERFVKRAASVICISPNDREITIQYYGRPDIKDIPTGVDVDYFGSVIRNPALEPTLVFTGSLDWEPNSEGIFWFVEQVFPLVKRLLPSCKVSIVGRNPSEALLGLARRTPGVEILGRVPDVRPYLSVAHAAIIPILTGGGTRMKIYESFAAGLPVVSTTIGAEGLQVTDNQNIFLRDDPVTFATAIVDLINDRDLAERIGGNARTIVFENFSGPRVAKEFERLCFPSEFAGVD
jgi:glycosyltransferase involved in cell wall biosynthesis